MKRGECMPDALDEIDGEVVVDETQVDDPEIEGSAADESAEAETADEVVLSIGDEAPPVTEDEGFNGQPAPTWVKELRAERKELLRKNRELEAEATKLRAAPVAESAVVVGDKPTLEACEYDAEKFADQLEKWHTRKRDAETQAEKRTKDQQAAQAAWTAKQTAYTKLKGELKMKDVDEAEEVAKSILSVTQQGLIIQGAENSALLIQAIGRNPKKAKELASLNDPVQFAFAVAKLETMLKVTPRKVAPLPERTVTGSAPVRADTTLARLEAEADKSGDRTKVAAYRRQLMLKAQGR